jgi:predicted nucleic acid-binding protein
MMLQSSFSSTGKSIVADASVVINILATKMAPKILGLLPGRIFVLDQVKAEVEEGGLRGRSNANGFGELVTAGFVEIVTLDEPAQEIFQQLTFGSTANTLDDGEAATIAYSVGVGGLALVDEKKAARIIGEKFPALEVFCTTDVLFSALLQSALSRDQLAEAVFNALQEARMQVPLKHAEWVVALIGAEKAAVCRSLPRAFRNSA